MTVVFDVLILEWPIGRRRRPHRTCQLAVFAILLPAFLLWWPVANASGDELQSLPIEILEPPLSVSGERKEAAFTFLPKAEKPWRVCVSIPHLKDNYWLAVNHCIIHEAKRLGLNVNLFEAGGYGHVDRQRRQIRQCMDSGGDGLILSAVHQTALNDIIKEYTAQGKPVVDLINGVDSQDITARVGVDYRNVGEFAAKYLVEQSRKRKKPLRVAWFPGPASAGWVQRADAGFREALSGSDVRIMAARYGDTNRFIQGQLVKEVLAAHLDLDWIVGTSVTAEAAIRLLRKNGQSETVSVLPFYYSPAVHKGVRRGVFPAATTDHQGYQARIAMNVLVSALEHKPFPRDISMRIQVVDRDNMADFDSRSSLAPTGYRPVFSYGSW